MKISHKLILGFLGIASLTGGIGAISVHQQSQTAKYLARQEAEEVAILLGYFTNHELEDEQPRSRTEILSHLQNHVLALHKQRQCDLEIVDRNKIILADVVTEDIGTQLEDDTNNEVGQTIQDGITRTYIETNSEHPKGIYLITVPFKNSHGETIGAVILEYTPLYKAAMAVAQKSIVATSIISLVCGVLALIAGFLISRNISNPIKQLQQAVLNLAEGKLDTRVTIHSQDEIGELATSFNTMAYDLQKSRSELLDANEQLQNEITERQQAEAELQQTLQHLQKTQAQLIQTEKISSLGQLVAGIAHEINNPVNFIHGNLTYIKEYVESLIGFVQLYQKHYPNPVLEIQAEAENIELEFLQEDLWKIVDSMNMGTSRIREIVRSLRNFSRMDEAEYKAVDIHEGIDSTLLILHHRLQAKGKLPAIELIREYGNLPLIECYAGQLNQVFMNLLANAIDAVEEANTKRSNQQIKDNPSRITIRTSLIDSQWVQIAIADTGTGIPETARHNLFNPFFTTKPVNKGTGMGLSISYQIITETHHGKLEYVSTPGEGTEFIIQIPIHQKVLTAV
ncbi:HAMP domain-containing protein [Tolypothrix sp. PCC 7910]|uniref:ATP-binding protein n=1 Tax=Tolypothrix sp. PCC 7910 TaxID=2099387 RepID=UPI0014278FA7|nr:ATP-binding protein [Tolypothrix sp. PCC 7910]QIR41147.1 HAMP domain-containing protein [Tolypothrix sp. PCC 7910]